MSINNSGAFFNNFQHFNSNIVNNSFAANQINMPENIVAPNQPKSQIPLLDVLPNTKEALKSAVKELATLNEVQTLTMVKDLIKFPKQFNQLLMQLTNQQNVTSLLNSNTDISKLSALIQNNSKEAISDLYKIVANYNQLGVSMKDEQLTHLTKLISFVSASSHSDVQSLKTTMLMYLPWLPLTDSEAFKLEIGNSNSNQEQAVGIDSVGVLISTQNYGNLQSQIIKTEEDGIKIEVISSQNFPLKDFVELMKQEGKRYNININFDLATKESFDKEKIEKTQTQVFLNTSPGVNPFLLLISNTLIKNVHELDIKESKRWQEKEIIENGES